MPIDLRTTIPRLNPACNVRTLPIGPREGFVLSRVDGQTSAADIGAMTGLGAEVLEALQKLASLGALLDVPGAPAPAPTPPPPAEPAAATAPSKPAAEPRRRRPGAPKYSQAELDELCDLDLEPKQRILEFYYELVELSHYEVLDVPQAADKKAIKAAYYKIAPEFHPDKYFRKSLGAFKAKMEAIFTRVTEAESVLTRKESRAEYDAYLTQRQRTREIEALLRGDVEAPPSAPPPAPPPPSSRHAVPSPQPSVPPPRPSAPPRATTPPTNRTPPAAPPRGVTPSSAPRTTASVSQVTPRPEDDRLRRQALAAKLSSGRYSPRPATPSPAPPPPAPVNEVSASARHAAASDSLRRMFVAKKHDTARDQIDRYIKSAEDAVAKGDPVAAANAYRLAMAHSPADESLAALANEWAARAAAILAANYLKQGEYEAREGRWAEAARSLVRAATGMADDPAVLNMAAHAILKAGGDLHQAADYAKRAVEIVPASVAFHVTLAEVYLGANLPLAARRVLEAAAKLDPKDGKVRALLERVR